MDPSLHTSQNSGLHKRTCCKEGENGFIGRKGHGHHFLGFARHHLHRLFGEGKGNHGAVLCYADLFGRFEAELMNAPAQSSAIIIIYIYIYTLYIDTYIDIYI